MQGRVIYTMGLSSVFALSWLTGDLNSLRDMFRVRYDCDV